MKVNQNIFVLISNIKRNKGGDKMSKTLTEIEAINQDMLTPAIVAEYLGVSPQAIRVQAKNRPELLGFPVIVIGSRVKIPKNAFIKFFKGKK